MGTRVRMPSKQEVAEMVATRDLARAVPAACVLPQGTTIGHQPDAGA